MTRRIRSSGKAVRAMGDKPCHWARQDVAQMLRLANALHEHGGAGVHAARLEEFLEGICPLIDASIGVLVVGRVEAQRGQVCWGPIGQMRTVGVHPAVGEALVVRTQPDGSLPDPALARLLRMLRRRRGGGSSSSSSNRAQASLTLTRRELVEGDQWGHCGALREVIGSKGIHDAVYSARMLECGSIACLCAYRVAKDHRRFNRCDCQTLDLLHAECSWIYRDAPSSQALHALDLSPREEEVLFKLLSGRAEKQIALEMNLSRNTVHHYVKAIYKRLRVSSRGELLARCMKISPDA